MLSHIAIFKAKNRHIFDEMFNVTFRPGSEFSFVFDVGWGCFLILLGKIGRGKFSFRFFPGKEFGHA